MNCKLFVAIEDNEFLEIPISVFGDCENSIIIETNHTLDDLPENKTFKIFSVFVYLPDYMIKEINFNKPMFIVNGDVLKLKIRLKKEEV